MSTFFANIPSLCHPQSTDMHDGRPLFRKIAIRFLDAKIDEESNTLYSIQSMQIWVKGSESQRKTSYRTYKRAEEGRHRDLLSLSLYRRNRYIDCAAGPLSTCSERPRALFHPHVKRGKLWRTASSFRHKLAAGGGRDDSAERGKKFNNT